MKVQVSELLVRYMERLGIRHIFGMPGAHILPVYDSIFDSPIKSVLAKHEQGAAFMACGYTRASGRIGACIATAGPGATNLITGVANAYVDKQPMLVLTGETSTTIFGKGGLQESSGEGGSVDQGALFQGITKYRRLVERTDYLANVLNQASNVLLSDNPGPVLLSLPFNIQKETVDAALLDEVRTQRPSYAAGNGRSALADTLAQMLLAARRPVMVAGFGALRAGAQAEVASLSAILGIPVATSLKGKGVVDEAGPLSLGSLGVTSGEDAHRYIVDEADLVLVLGAGFNERTSYLWEPALLAGKRVVQVDIDPGQLEKVFQADLAIRGDVRETLKAVLEYVEARVSAPPHASLPPRRRSGEHSPLKDPRFALVEAFFERLAARFPEGMQLFDDNIIFAQNYLNVTTANRYYPNSGVSSLGHAIPAAIGARFVDARRTFAVLGDGGFQMCCMELMTAVNYGIPLTVVLFNNGTMGLVRKNQCQHYDKRYIDSDFRNPDYAALAAAFGVAHYRIDSAGAIDPVLDRVDVDNGINIIEIPVDRDAFPGYCSGR